MYICICNAITESDLENNPFIINIVGNQCGICIKNPIKVSGATYHVDKFDTGTKTPINLIKE